MTQPYTVMPTVAILSWVESINFRVDIGKIAYMN